ncbi:hypothetical protein RvY_07289 [Ramazzottius varieornatus]|uniref:Uncharacterized protein n=1 Tax=Ramazzottius varieornatus TaxID=947166 RepID=A0A1D1V4T2_RAMVA|nr:hypothetical protein RvY_07289 [Ramazzottius varieornatus]
MGAQQSKGDVRLYNGKFREDMNQSMPLRKDSVSVPSHTTSLWHDGANGHPRQLTQAEMDEEFRRRTASVASNSSDLHEPYWTHGGKQEACHETVREYRRTEENEIPRNMWIPAGQAIPRKQ